jgi:hypothetical protein
VFKRRNADVYIVADAYRGDEIRQAILDFFDAASGGSPEPITVSVASAAVSLSARGGAELVAYVGHDGLMDFRLQIVPRRKDEIHRDVIILACASKQYFSEPLRASGAYPLLWTTGLMAPEAYTLKSALDGAGNCAEPFLGINDLMHTALSFEAGNSAANVSAG